MLETIPCVRDGQVGASDSELMSLLTAFIRTAPSADHAIASLYAQHDGEIWATWGSEHARAELAPTLSALCRERGEHVRHVVSVDEDYDYQEDVPPTG